MSGNLTQEISSSKMAGYAGKTSKPIARGSRSLWWDDGPLSNCLRNLNSPLSRVHASQNRETGRAHTRTHALEKEQAK
jgi:hypothetical protein